MDNQMPRARAIAACVTSLKLLKSQCPSSGPLHLPEFAVLSTADFKTETATGSVALETAVEKFIDSISHGKTTKASKTTAIANTLRRVFNNSYPLLQMILTVFQQVSQVRLHFMLEFS